MNDDELKTLFTIKTTDIGDKFEFQCGAGFDLNLIAFGISAFIRALVRDKVIEDGPTFVGSIIAYITNPQYDEYKEEENVDDRETTKSQTNV